jgi:hypothetical protein
MFRITLLPAQAAAETEPPRLELEMPLDGEGRIVEAGPHAARLHSAGGVLAGDCLAEPDGSHFLRFPAGPDVPVHGWFEATARFRPGDVLMLWRGNGAEEFWRVVSVQAATSCTE